MAGRLRWFVALFVALAVVAGACSSDDDDAGGERDREEDAAGSDAEAIAERWIEQSVDLDDEVRQSLQVTRTVERSDVTHVHFGQFYEDIPVRRAEIIVHVLEDGTVQGATTSLSDAAPPAEANDEVGEEGATSIASKAAAGSVTETASANKVWLQDGDRLRLGWSVLLATEDPPGAWTVWVDAVTGAVADTRNVIAHAGQTRGDACDVGEAPSACVFLPDPIFASNGEIERLADANDFLTGQPLLGLDDPESGALVGEFVNLESDESSVPPVRERDGTFGAGRAQDGFEAAMAYFWIDRTQRKMQELGFDVRDESFEVVPVEAQLVDNAFYTPAEQLIVLGVGTGGVNFGEDASVIIHEYGHAILDEQAPGLIASPAAGAYHESFGDLLALLMTLEHRGGDPACLTAWVLLGDCLRRIDSDKVFPDDLANEVHDDGEIYNGAVFDILEALLAEDGLEIADCAGTEDCNEVRDRVLTTLIASNDFLTGEADLPTVAQAYQLANEAFFDGADAALIDEAFDAHGLADGSGSTLDRDGNPTGGVEGTLIELDITHTFPGDLRLTLHVVDEEREDLCEPIVLFEPDTGADGTGLAGRVDVSDSDCAELVPPSRARQWVLAAEDTLEDDEGRINTFKVITDGTPFLAVGLPRPIPDDDATGAVAVVNGRDREDDDGVGDGGEGPAFSVAIDHSFVGDLSLRGGVADADGRVTCSVDILTPDPDDDGSSLEGDADMSDCAEHFPPSADRLWFLEVVDTAAEDSGTVEALALTAPDGGTAELRNVPVEIPDDDPDGVVLVFDGASWQRGGAGDAPTIAVEITHPFAGDVAVKAGVADADGDLLCSETLATPDPEDDGEDLSLDVAVPKCAGFFPPSPDRVWFVQVIDTAADDEGRVVRAEVRGIDGRRIALQDVPADIPDADPDGVLLVSVVR